MVMEQLGFAAIGVPGANAWQDNWDDYFADTRRIYIALDPDDVGHRAAEKLRAKLAPRSRIIDLPVPDDADPKDVDPSWLAQKGLLTKELIDDLLAKSSGSLLVTVDEAVASHAELANLSGIRFGVPELDDFITPGLLPTQVMVFLARSGLGKTLLCLNLMQLMAMEQPDMKFFFVSLEQTRSEWWERARRIHRFYNLDSDDAGAMAFWRERLLIADQNRMNEDTLLALLDEYRYEMGKAPDVIFLDYLGYWAQSFRGERYDRGYTRTGTEARFSHTASKPGAPRQHAC